MSNKKLQARVILVLFLALAAVSCANFPPQRATEPPPPTDTPLAPTAVPTDTSTPLPPPPTATLTPVMVAALTPTPTPETVEAASESKSEPTATSPLTSTPPPPPPPTATSAPTELLINGNFEEGFGTDGLATGWSKFSNGDAGFGWYDDTWPPVVLEGEHSQLISIVNPNYNDRYIGIYQTVDVIPDQTYELTLNGLVRANTPDEQYGHRLYWAVDYAGGTDWQAVDNWVELSWDQQPLVTDEFTADNYTTIITSTGKSLTLFIRGHSKWPRQSEANFNLDNLSLRGVPGGQEGAQETMPITGKTEINWVPIVALIALLLILFREAWRGVLGSTE
ncbi:MAG: hypothetical protein B6I34_02680 [Anaerolineaceae bacterium 4572_32.1]|nr:MAG: hypothetical protein B6I34_02680 [Anaerolineaceae bacterium 4572_32.1]